MISRACSRLGVWRSPSPRCHQWYPTNSFLRHCSGGVKEAVDVSATRRSSVAREGPGLEHFIANVSADARTARPLKVTPPERHPYITEESMNGNGRLVYFDVYGCQMNVNDTEVIWSILSSHGFNRTTNPLEADLWLIVTCSIREGAESKIWKKLHHLKLMKKGYNYKSTLKIGLLGCMAERLKDKLLEKDHLVDVVAGPDSYRDLPRLFAITTTSDESSINVMLSLEETYADIIPMRLNENQITGFVSIQRGCDNMCSFCIVPYTRGRERSRPVASIVNEVKYLADNGVKEVTLLGQNVNSYRDTSEESISLYGGLPPEESTHVSSGFRSIYRAKTGGVRFADLLARVSEVDPEVRVRFVSPHPKDFPDEVLHLIAERKNICKNVHLPAQSGSSRVLELMRRGYTREAYLELVNHIRSVVPDVSFSSDFIAGFCGETYEEFQETLSLIEIVKYHRLYMFPYSLREKTHAHRKLQDDVPEEEKKKRCDEMIALYRKEVEILNRKFIGSYQTILIEGDSKRSTEYFQGKTDGNIKVIFPKSAVESSDVLNPGNYCVVKIVAANSQVLQGETLFGTTLADSATKECYANKLLCH